MPEDIDREMTIDNEHLKLVSLGYMISAGFAAFFSVFGLFYLVMGIAMSVGLSRMHTNPGNQPPPAFVGWIFGGMGLVFFVFAAGMAVLRFIAARCVKRRKSRTFCIVIAALSCLEFPYGTTIGVLSLIVLSRESVRRQFEAHSALAGPV